MIITKYQQEKIFMQYVDGDHNEDECNGFIAGINSTIKLVNEIIIAERNKAKDISKDS